MYELSRSPTKPPPPPLVFCVTSVVSCVFLENFKQKIGARPADIYILAHAQHLTVVFPVCCHGHQYGCHSFDLVSNIANIMLYKNDLLAIQLAAFRDLCIVDI